MEIGTDAEELVVLRAASGNSIDRLKFSADGNWLAASGQAGEVYLWDCEISKPRLAKTIKLHTWISQLTWHPTLPHLAIAHDTHIKIWDAHTSQDIVTWKSDKSSTADLAWHPSGEYLAIAGNKGVAIWTNYGQVLPSLSLHVDTASLQIAWSPDGRYLACGNFDRSLSIMDLDRPTDPWILQGCPGKIRQLDWLCHSTQPCLIVATGAAVVQWSLIGNEWVGQLMEGHQGSVTAVVACRDRQMFVSAATDNHACLWFATGEVAQIITSQNGEFTALAWHPADLWLVTGTRSGSIELWRCPA